MPVRFPYLHVLPSQPRPAFAPLMPLALQFENRAPIEAQGLLDSGAAVNVLPYSLGLRLGADWDRQTLSVKLTGNLAQHEARALLVNTSISGFDSIRLVCAWTRSDQVPLLLGQVNFFEEFNVCFRRSQLYFELERASL